MPCPPLHDDFIWRPRHVGGISEDMVLMLGTREVAMVNARADGRTWLSEVNRHAPDWTRKRHGVHLSRRHGMRMVERWAAVHAIRIRAEIAAEPPRSGIRYAVSYGREGCDTKAPSSPA